ncbi:small-subunit processome, Utp12 [Artemisia annua]|uniref:Small-subunit processome, Utp12 n=1 Tax=Artemisia annua TaxID=35608 RepID=A0A2U1LSJ2_ARTAN|nr:small-subunit processome, Utp12 [Artemisia annua]
MYNFPVAGDVVYEVARRGIGEEDGSLEKPETSPAKPPSADSVHVLLKQASHADDRSLLLDYLFRQNEKVNTNSVSLLKPLDVFKLLKPIIL